MVTLVHSELSNPRMYNGHLTQRAVFWFEGTSDDDKPATRYRGALIQNGSRFFEMDTATHYKYNEDSASWLPQVDERTSELNAAASASAAAASASAAAASAAQAQAFAEAYLAAFPTDTATGESISITDGAALPVKALSVAIDPVQSGEGDPGAENIRAITGHTAVALTVNGVVVAIALDTTVFGGSLDVLEGMLTVTKGVIASYDGEELPGEWMSDRDVYEEGGTPTTGAQVVYDLAEAVTVELTAQEISTVLGNNSISADTGDVSVTYRADPTLYIARKIAAAISGLS